MNSMFVAPMNGQKLQTPRISTLVEQLEEDFDNVNAWFVLGALLSTSLNSPTPIHKSTHIHGVEYDGKMCFIEALRLNSKYAQSWLGLGFVLVSGSAVVNGREYSQRDCYVEALTLDPSVDPNAWHNLGAALTSSETVSINGRIITKKDCFLEALRLSPHIAPAWFGIGFILAQKGVNSEKIALNGRQYSARDCYKESLALNPKFPQAWLGLGYCMKPLETELVGGKEFTNTECFIQALSLNPSIDSNAWFLVGVSLGSQELLAQAVAPPPKSAAAKRIAKLTAEYATLLNTSKGATNQVS